MRVLFSTQSTVQFDGQFYYSNPIQSEYKRYLELSNDITVFCHIKKVEKATHDKVDQGALKFVFAEKINSVKAILKRYSKKNDKIAKEEVLKADICAVSLPSGHGNQVIKYCKLYGKPYITTVCGCPWDTLWYYDWRGKIIAPFAYLSLRKVQKDAPYSIYVSQKFLQTRYPTTGKSIGCSNASLHTGIVEVLNRRYKTIHDIEINPRALRIGTAAAIDVPYKGQQYVIEALAELKKKGLLFEYHLLGRGDNTRLRTLAERLNISSQVFFHGAMPHEEVMSFMDGLDIYIQPSKTEGLPRALVEAMSRGCLCMGSKAGGIPELIDSAYVFKKENVHEIMEILSNISIDNQYQQADRNFHEASQYDVSVLEKKRKQFLLSFKNSLGSKS